MNSMMDENELIDMCLKQNPRAQKTLFDKYAPKMFSVSLRYMKNTELAEDVLQEGFVKVFLKLKEFKREGSFEGWIRRIIVNTSLDAIRKNAKTKFDQPIDDVSYKLEYKDPASSSLETQDLLNLVKNMPSGYRVVFNMFAIEGYSHKEIAEKLNVTENTSKSQYLRARAYLRDRLEKLE